AAPWRIGIASCENRRSDPWLQLPFRGIFVVLHSNSLNKEVRSIKTRHQKMMNVWTSIQCADQHKPWRFRRITLFRDAFRGGSWRLYDLLRKHAPQIRSRKTFYIMITPYLPNSNLTPDIEKMLKVWTRIQPETSQPSALSNLDPDEIVSSIFAMGPFYYYGITFTDMSVGEISANFGTLHGIRPCEVRHISDVLTLIHPDDMEFVVKAEERAVAFIGSLSLAKALRYKAS